MYNYYNNWRNVMGIEDCSLKSIANERQTYLTDKIK